MNMHKFHSLTVLALTLVSVACQPRQEQNAKQCSAAQEQESAAAVAVDSRQTSAKTPSPVNSMVEIRATNQPFVMVQPWTKAKPSHSIGFGIYVGNGKILTAANIVYSAGFVELTSPDGSRTVSANVSQIDTEANLALLTLKNEQDADFLADMAPIELGEPISLGQQVTFWQFNSAGVPILTPGTLQGTDVNIPFTFGEPFVLYDFKTALNALRGNAGNPVTVNDKLVGLTASCNTKEQQVSAITLPMIRNFLTQAESGNYVGFPLDGTQVSDLTDPVFCKYLGLPANSGGLYVVKLPEYSSFYKAGLRAGDVVTSVNGKPLDAKGLFQDEHLGPIPVNYLFRDTAMPGDTLQLGILRKTDQGERQATDLTVTLDRAAFDRDLINQTPFIDQPPYRIYGGLVFVPLTQALLDQIHKLTQNRTPLAFLEALEHTEELQKQGVQEIVVLLSALPTEATKGYESMAPSIVTAVNGVPVKNLKHLNQLLDSHQGEINHIQVNQQPYSIYMDKTATERANRLIQMRVEPKLRRD